MDSKIFCYVLVGEERIPCRMIMCHPDNSDEKSIKKLIRVAFPELFSSWKFLRRFKKIKTRKVFNCEGYPSFFDEQVKASQKNNDWGFSPYVTLEIFLRERDIHCQPISYVL